MLCSCTNNNDVSKSPRDLDIIIEKYNRDENLKTWYNELLTLNDDKYNNESIPPFCKEILNDQLQKQTQIDGATYFNFLGINYIAEADVNGIITYNDKKVKYKFLSEDEFMKWYAYQVYIGAELPALNEYKK